MSILENKEQLVFQKPTQDRIVDNDAGRSELSLDNVEKVHGIPLNDTYTLAAFLLTSMNITVNEGKILGESPALSEQAHEAIKKSCVILNHALDRALNIIIAGNVDNINIASFPSYALEGAMIEDRRASCFFLSEKGVLCFKGEGRDAKRALPMQEILKVIKLKEEPNAHLSHKQVQDDLKITLLRMDEHINNAKASNDSKDGWAKAEINSSDAKRGRSR